MDSRGNFFGDCVKNVGKVKSKNSLRKLARSKVLLRQQQNQQVNEPVNPGFRFSDIKRSFAAGDWDKTIEIARNLLQHKQISNNNNNCVANIHRYAALAYVSKGRHDHAVVEVSKMIQAAKQSNDVKLLSRSLAVVGKVHLTFGYVHATAKAWERLSRDITEAILKAWLLHEIGRCYFEMSHFTKALEFARKCVSYSEQAQSAKWKCYGKILAGQAFIELGQLIQGLESLKLAAEILDTEINDNDLLNYVLNLIKTIYYFMRKKYHQANFSGNKNFIKPFDGTEKNAEVLIKINDHANQQNVDRENFDKNSEFCFTDKWKMFLTRSKSSIMTKSGSVDFHSSNVIRNNDSTKKQVLLSRYDLEKEEEEEEKEIDTQPILSDKMSLGLTKVESYKLSCPIKKNENKNFKLESPECFEMTEDQSDESILTNRTYDITC